MGACESCSSQETKVKNDFYRYYKNNILQSLSTYSFDEGMQGAFLHRICKENEVSQNVAEIWIKLYKLYMVYVGWQYSPNDRMKKNPTIDAYLVAPYEILQVWRAHVLFTNKYKEFCKVVTKGALDFIEYVPPKLVWRKVTDLEVLRRSLKINMDFLNYIGNDYRNEINSLFIFQSCYLKNCLHFNIEKGGLGEQIYRNIVDAYEREFQNPNGIFAIQQQQKDLNSLKDMMFRIEAMIINCTIPETFQVPPDFAFHENTDPSVINNSIKFQNMTLPEMFLERFCYDHLTSKSRGEMYLLEYKKYMFLYGQNQNNFIMYVPSEEVDLIWHYHLTHTKDYKNWSSILMGKPIFEHNPATGNEGEDQKMRYNYQMTIDTLKNTFQLFADGSWPPTEKRFNQNFRWLTHHNFLQNCSVWKNNNQIYQRDTYVYNHVVVGCYLGCGYIYGRPMIIGCGPVIIGGCGAVVVGCSAFVGSGCVAVYSCGGGCSWGFGCGSSCGGGASSCSGGASSCSSGCGGGSSCGSGCGGGGCGGGCGGG